MTIAGLFTRILPLILCLIPAHSRAGDISVFAAASLTNALTEVADSFTAQGGDRVRLSFASSSALAKQINNGAPAQIYVSADQDWMDYLADQKAIVAGSRTNLLANSLVLIQPKDAKTLNIAITPQLSLAKLAGDQRIAVGDPQHVPAGRYAQQAITALGQWAEIEPKLARTDNVRAALALVERGEVALGIVYGTDAAISKNVQVVATFPAQTHAAIIYPAALVAGDDSPAARSFLAFMGAPAAKAIFVRHGFRVN